MHYIFPIMRIETGTDIGDRVLRLDQLSEEDTLCILNCLNFIDPMQVGNVDEGVRDLKVLLLVNEHKYIEGSNIEADDGTSLPEPFQLGVRLGDDLRVTILVDLSQGDLQVRHWNHQNDDNDHIRNEEVQPTVLVHNLSYIEDVTVWELHEHFTTDCETHNGR